MPQGKIKQLQDQLNKLPKKQYWYKTAYDSGLYDSALTWAFGTWSGYEQEGWQVDQTFIALNEIGIAYEFWFSWNHNKWFYQVAGKVEIRFDETRINKELFPEFRQLTAGIKIVYQDEPTLFEKHFREKLDNIYEKLKAISGE